MHNHAFRVLGLPVTRMLFQTQSRHCRCRFAEMAYHIYLLIISFFRVLDVLKARDRGRYEYIELNDYHLKAVNGRPVIMHIFLWDRAYALLAARPTRHIE